MPMKVTAVVCCTAAPAESVLHGARKLLHIMYHQLLRMYTEAKAMRKCCGRHYLPLLI